MQKVLAYMKLNKVYIGGIMAIIVVGMVLNLYLITKPKFTSNEVKGTHTSSSSFSSSEDTKQELDTLQQIMDAISKHIVLPNSEEPLMATVGDKAQLPDQEFFKKAENGDKILIYKKTKKAFLYRPSLDKLIDVAPLNFEESAKPAKASVQEEGPADQKTDVFPKASGKVLLQTQE